MKEKKETLLAKADLGTLLVNIMSKGQSILGKI